MKKTLDIESVEQLIRIGKNLLAESDVKRLLPMAMDYAIEVSDAERGIIILFDEKSNILFETARNIEREEIEHPEFQISRTIIEKVKNERKGICLKNALSEKALRKQQSITQLNILSVMCLPLLYQESLFGMVYLDNRRVEGVFSDDTFVFVKEFTDYISFAAFKALERKKLETRIDAMEEELRTRFDFDAIVGHSPKMVEILKIVAQVGDTNAPVLIEGETGTGKELIARAIHFNSSRKEKPLLSMNCGAIPESLLESELFGHERGAFTGAYKQHKGKFELADGGTLFLDEVDEMSASLQVRLLRILQWGEYTPLGSDENRLCDVRIVAASKRPLRVLVEEGDFRDDLYYRLNLIRIELPTLRERREDILLLAQTFLMDVSKNLPKDVPKLSPEVEQVLLNYPFPGNVRELENLIHRAVILCNDSVIRVEHLPPEIRSDVAFSETVFFDTSIPFKEAKKRIVEDFEKRYIESILRENGGVIRDAAERAGLHEKNLYEKMVKYGFRRNQFKKENKHR